MQGIEVCSFTHLFSANILLFGCSSQIYVLVTLIFDFSSFVTGVFYSI